jgi:hypothetical protein
VRKLAGKSEVLMKQLLASISSVGFSAGLLALLVSFPLRGQKSGSPQQPSPPGNTGAQPQPGSVQPSNHSQNQIQGPIFVSGRIVMENGQSLAESAFVELKCDTASRSLPAIHTDRKGFFEFVVGSGAQPNLDFSASSGVPLSSGPASTNLSGENGLMGNSLTGCEVQASAPGYQPLNYTIFNPPDMSRIEIGTLPLKRLGAAPAPAVSVTSLLAPGSARQEFENGESDLRDKRLKTAAEHLEKAVALYDQYAAAWSELGKVYFASREAEKAYQAFGKAITIDPKYIQPYIGLANLQLQQQKDEDAVATAEKALQLEPGNPTASFLAAAGNFNLNRLEAAEKNAREAETRAAGNIPLLHALLADILLRKQDYQNAAGYIRTYLKESPNGQFAERLKKDLQQIEAKAGNADMKAGSSPTAP